MSADQQVELCEQVQAAAVAGEPLAIVGGGTRRFQCAPVRGRPLELAQHSGIVDYQPEELVLTARAGTRLTELEAALADAGQMLPFEPPRFGAAATLGGAVALGASGPRRPWTGAVRDFVLGVRIINGQGAALRFGGQVMKNVAGYDIARLMAGARGTLGVLTEISLKVLPYPEHERTLRMELNGRRALQKLAEWGRTPLPLSAAAWEQESGLRLRLSGSEYAVQAAARRIGGEEDAAGAAYWQSIRDLRHPLLQADSPRLWRMTTPPAAPLPAVPHDSILLDWGGGQRWLQSDFSDAHVHAMAARAGGYAMPVRCATPPPLPRALHELHQRLKLAFDPRGVLNPGALGAF